MCINECRGIDAGVMVDAGPPWQEADPTPGPERAPVWSDEAVEQSLSTLELSPLETGVPGERLTPSGSPAARPGVPSEPPGLPRFAPFQHLVLPAAIIAGGMAVLPPKTGKTGDAPDPTNRPDAARDGYFKRAPQDPQPLGGATAPMDGPAWSGNRAPSGKVEVGFPDQNGERPRLVGFLNTTPVGHVRVSLPDDPLRARAAAAEPLNASFSAADVGRLAENASKDEDVVAYRKALTDWRETGFRVPVDGAFRRLQDAAQRDWAVSRAKVALLATQGKEDRQLTRERDQLALLVNEMGSYAAEASKPQNLPRVNIPGARGSWFPPDHPQALSIAGGPPNVANQPATAQAEATWRALTHWRNEGFPIPVDANFRETQRDTADRLAAVEKSIAASPMQASLIGLMSERDRLSQLLNGMGDYATGLAKQGPLQSTAPVLEPKPLFVSKGQLADLVNERQPRADVKAVRHALQNWRGEGFPIPIDAGFRELQQQAMERWSELRVGTGVGKSHRDPVRADEFDRLGRLLNDLSDYAEGWSRR